MYVRLGTQSGDSDAICLISDEICLYTMTPDSVVRVFMTVIDAPNHLQLHAALDRWSFLPGHPDALSGEDDDAESSQRPPDPVFWIDRAAFLSTSLVQDTGQATSEVEQGRRRKLKDLVDDDWELFGFITRGGCLIVRALTVRSIQTQGSSRVTQFCLEP